MLNNLISHSLVLSVLTAAPLSLASQPANPGLDIIATECEENVGSILELWIEGGRIWSPNVGRFVDNSGNSLLPSEHPTYEIDTGSTLTLSAFFRNGTDGMDVLLYDELSGGWTYYDTLSVNNNYGRISLPIGSSFKLELLDGGLSEEVFEYPYEDERPEILPPENKNAVLKPVKDCTD